MRIRSNKVLPTGRLQRVSVKILFAENSIVGTWAQFWLRTLITIQPLQRHDGINVVSTVLGLQCYGYAKGTEMHSNNARISYMASG